MTLFESTWKSIPLPAAVIPLERKANGGRSHGPALP